MNANADLALNVVPFRLNPRIQAQAHRAQRARPAQAAKFWSAAIVLAGLAAVFDASTPAIWASAAARASSGNARSAPAPVAIRLVDSNTQAAYLPSEIINQAESADARFDACGCGDLR